MLFEWHTTWRDMIAGRHYRLDKQLHAVTRKTKRQHPVMRCGSLKPASQR